MSRRRNRGSRKTAAELPKAEYRPPRIARWLFTATVIAFVGCVAANIAFRVREKNEAESAITQMGGTVKRYQTEEGIAGDVDFSGKPFGDADLAKLVPLLNQLSATDQLNLANTQVTDAGLKHLQSLHYLDELCLDGCAIQGTGLQYLAHMGRNNRYSNVVLSLKDTSVDDTAISGLRECAELNELILANCPVTGSGFVHLRGLDKLHRLMLPRCPIVDASLPYIAEMEELMVVNLSGTQVTGAGLSALRPLQYLDSLQLDGLDIQDGDLVGLYDFPKLGGLSLAGTKITDATLRDLRDNTRLTGINLNATAITDAGLAQLAGWPTLTSLSLENTAITDVGLLSLANVPNLYRLYLRDSKFTMDGLAELKKLNPKVLADY